MSYTPQNLAELRVLMLFNSPTGLEGIKVHKYLTQLGIETAEHAHSLFYLLNSSPHE